MSLALTDAIGWVVVAGFTLSALLATRDDAHPARVVAAGSWVVFAVFWALLIEHFLIVKASIIEGVLVILAVPLCLYTAKLVLTTRPRILMLSRAIAVMGLVYLPFQTFPALANAAISITAQASYALITLLGYHPDLLVQPDGYPHAIQFAVGDHTITTYVLLACSGIGSIATVVGLITATTAPIRRRLTAIAIVAPIIYALNIIRVAFIAIAFGNQWFAWTKPLVFAVFPTTDPYKVSYYFADRILAQSLSVVVLVAITLGLLRILPELAALLDDALYIATRNEYNLRERFTE